MKLSKLAIIAALAGMLPAIAGANLAEVPEASFLIQLTETGGASATYTAPGTYVLGGATASAAAFPSPSLTAHSGGGNYGSESTITYYYAVVGGQDGIPIPLFVTFALHASAEGPLGATDSAMAKLNVEGLTVSIHEGVQAENTGPSPSDFSGTLSFDQLSGRPGVVELFVQAGTNLGGSADAFVDPYIFIDPNFLAEHPGYSVIVSEGIGNAAPGAPEPATLALLAGGLLGFAARRRRL